MPSSLMFGADFHLGAYQYGLAVREDDYRRAFETFITKVISVPNTNAALLGDIGDLPHEARKILHIIREGVSRAAAAGRTIYYIAGNHDCDKPSLPVALGMPGFVDAQEAFYAALAAGKPFTPYGADGPKVCALHSTSHADLFEQLAMIRERELPENRSTELWLHQAIAPGAPKSFAEFDVVDFINLGWHTVIAGDIHNRCLWSVNGQTQQGIIAYPGSPEMTDINEKNQGRGFLLHSPKDNEPLVTPASFAMIPYQHRPYRTFECEGPMTDEQVQEVIAFSKDCQESTGMLPIIRIISADTKWRNYPPLLSHALKLLYKRPEVAKVETVPTAPAEVLANGEIGGGNAARYGSASGPGTLFQKLNRVLEASDCPPEVKALGETVLSNPVNPEKWLQAAEAGLAAAQ